MTRFATLKDLRSAVAWPMFAAVFVLMAFGVLFIYSASSATDVLARSGDDDGGGVLASFASWLRQEHIKQMVGYALGLGCVAAVTFVDYKFLARWSFVAYLGALASLMAVFAIGAQVNGARRWITLGPLSVQPSEFMKLAFVLALANYLSRPNNEVRQPRVFWRSLAMAAAPFLLILMEPDLGSSLVLIPVTLAIMFYAGANAVLMRRMVVGGCALVAYVVVDAAYLPPKYRVVPIQQYQRERLLVWLDRDFVNELPADASSAEKRAQRQRQADRAYSINQALIAVGSGGLLGRGWREGPQNVLGFLPRGVVHNDFIFSVIAHEAGFLGGAAVILCYGVILFYGVRIAGQARDQLGQLIAVGSVTLLFTHVFINIGMNIRIMPVTGVPLPLLSAGGSSAVCSLIAVGLLHNVYVNRRNY